MMSAYSSKRLSGVDATLAWAIVALLVVGCVALALVVSVTTGNCHASFAIPLLCQPSVGLPAAILIAALPLLVFGTARHPLATLFALYIVLVPIDDVLLVGSSLTVTKLLGIAVAVAAIATIVKRGIRIRLPFAVFGWGAVVGMMALSLAWSIDPTLSIETLVTIVSAYALFVIIVAVPMEPEEFRAVIAGTIASGVVVGIIAMFSARHELSTLSGQVGRLYLTFGGTTLDPNRFGASLLLSVAMTLGAIGQTRGWARIGLIAVLPFPLTAIYLTASRGTTLALIAMAIVGIIASRYRLALSAALAVVVGLMLAIPNEITSRFFEEGTLASGAGRLYIWRVAIEVFRRHWLLGSGVGTFPSAYDRAFMLAFQPVSAGWTRAPHSLLISTATESGIVGIVVMIVALILQYRSVRSIGPEHPYPWLRTVFRATFVGLLVAATFVDVLGAKFSWLLFTEMLLAVGLAMRRPIVRPE